MPREVHKFVSSTVVSSIFFSQLLSVRKLSVRCGYFLITIVVPIQNLYEASLHYNFATSLQHTTALKLLGLLVPIENSIVEQVLGLCDQLFGHRIEKKVQFPPFYLIRRPSLQFCNQFATPYSSETCFAVSTHCKLDYRTGLRSVRSPIWSQNSNDGQNSTVLLNSENSGILTIFSILWASS